MTHFWLATFVVDPPADDAVGPIAAAGTGNVAIEVLRNEEGWAVLFSAVDNPKEPTALTCVIGFSNMAKPCSVWLERGFPLVDAVISLNEAGALTVVSPFFGGEQSVMRYDTQLLSLSAIEFGSAKRAIRSSPAASLHLPYRQHLQAPDGAQPDVFVSRRPVTWLPERLNVRKLWPDYVSEIRLDFGDVPARWPNLAPLKTSELIPIRAWTGELQVPDSKQRTLDEKLQAQKVAHAFGVPAFRFEDVEVLGFRIDLAELPGDFRPGLAQLVNPLNFHLIEPETGATTGGGRVAMPDFRYRAATATLVIELLRYGRMKARVPSPPLLIDDSQSQHELVVRLLVGRTDDDSAQARAPAVYVPAIFVDNPWSKVVGRDAIGYDKRMAEFCVDRDGKRVRLLPDGRTTIRPTSGVSAEQTPEPLGAITRVNLVDLTGVDSKQPLLELSFSTLDHMDPDALLPIDLDLAFGTSMLSGARWRQSDFDDAEFRRSFARLAVAESVRSFRSIQVAPVVDRNVGKTWVTGRFTLDDDIRSALPVGVATLKLHAARRNDKCPARPSAPASWNLLCEMLGDGNTATISLATGSWYRLFCSMDLMIDDGLDWGTLSS